MHGKTVHWGICSSGKICQDFVNVLESLPQEEHKVKAIAASTLERAEKFAREHSIPRAHESYKELAEDPDVDIVYIGSLSSHHYAHAKLMLESGKPVLCEKPICTSLSDVKQLFALAKEKKLFLMEAIWSRCFPIYGEIKKVIESGEIGEVRMVQSSFGDNLSNRPEHRNFNKELGGGTLFDIGIYQIQLAQFIFEETPIEQVISGFLNESGVDIHSGMTLKYSNNRICSMASSSICCFANEASVCGTKGFITIHAPFWCPTAFAINGKKREFPLPETGKKYNYRNSQGLRFEAMEVRRCLMENLLESPRVTHAMSLEIAEIIDNGRKRLGYD